MPRTDEARARHAAREREYRAKKAAGRIKLPPQDTLAACPNCGTLHAYGLFCSPQCRREVREQRNSE